MILCIAALPLAADDHKELLNQEEREWLENLREPIIVGAEDNYLPYSFLDENGELSGVAGDYLRLIEERLGIRFAIHEYRSFAATLEAARDRHIDIVPFAVATDDRREYLDFTQPFFDTRDRILVRAGSDEQIEFRELSGLSVGLVEGYALQADIETNHPDINLVLMPNELEGLRALSLGMLDVLIVGRKVPNARAGTVTQQKPDAGDLVALPLSVASTWSWPGSSRLENRSRTSLPPGCSWQECQPRSCVTTSMCL